MIKKLLSINSKDSERGASLVEYALLVGLVAIVSLIGVSAVGDGIRAQFFQIEHRIAGGDICDPLQGC